MMRMEYCSGDQFLLLMCLLTKIFFPILALMASNIMSFVSSNLKNNLESPALQMFHSSREAFGSAKR